jgi:hypothetical protein
MEGTRLSILNEAKSWVEDTKAEQIFWLADVAGSGKSTVANHLARQWKLDGRLAGRFFFSREAEQTRNITYFFSTVAQQGLSRLGSKVQRTVGDGIRELLDPVSATLKEQCEWLFVLPLKAVSSPVVLVLDALDECDEASLNRLFQMLLAQLSNLPHLKLFLTSRPESYISEILQGKVPRRVNLTGNQLDVERFMNEKLVSLSIPEEQIKQLVARSAGLFIWASTVCKLLKIFRGDRDQFISGLMVQGPRQLDLVYEVALEQAVSAKRNEVANLEAYRSVLNIIVMAFEPLSPHSIDSMLQIENTFEIVKDLQSVLDCPSPDKPVRFLHPTFREFLLQPLNNHPCHVEEREAHLSLTQACLRVMARDLRWDLCHLFRKPIKKSESLYEKIGQKGSVDDDLKEHYQRRLIEWTSHELRYSCIFWGQHLDSSKVGKTSLGETTRLYLGRFFQQNLLDWMYLLSFIKSIKAPWTLLRTLILIPTVSSPFPDYLIFVH